MTDEYWMMEALKEAEIAFQENEVPIGAVIVKDNTIIASAHNQCLQYNDPAQHAESIALRKAHSNGYDLSQCTLYVTVEPCAMCTGMILLYHVQKLVYGAFNAVTGCCGSKIDLTDNWFDTSVQTIGGVLEEESKSLLSSFFSAKR